MSTKVNTQTEEERLFIDNIEVDMIIDETNTLHTKLKTLVGQYTTVQRSLEQLVHDYSLEGSNPTKTIEITVGPSTSNVKNIDVSKYGNVIKVLPEPVNTQSTNDKFFVSLKDNILRVQNTSYTGTDGELNSNTTKVQNYPNGWEQNLILRGIVSSNFNSSNVKVSELVNTDDVGSQNGTQFLGVFKEMPQNAMTQVSMDKEWEENNGELGFKGCKKYALDNGYQYFGLGGNITNPAISGNRPNDFYTKCSVSNNLQEATQYGHPTSGWGIGGEGANAWSGSPDNSACSKESDGFNYGGNWVGSIYKARAPGEPTVEFIGTFEDSWDRAIPNYVGYNTWEECKTAAINQGYDLFGRQDGNREGYGQCFLGSDWGQAWEYGSTDNEFRDVDGKMMGGGWVNATYGIWQTPAKPQYEGCFNTDWYNNNFPFDLGSGYDVESCNAEANSLGYKYFSVGGPGGQGGSTCSLGNDLQEGTKNGRPNTSILDEDGNVFGGYWTNAIYKVDKVGKPEFVSKFGFVDKDNKLREYPNSMIKNNEIVNNKSCPKTYVDIDSTEWSNFAKGDMMTPDTICGLKKEINADRQKLLDLEEQMNPLVNKIEENINQIESLNINLNKYSSLDKQSIKSNISTYKQVNNKINNLSHSQNNITGRIKDSVINVKSNNLSYILWLIIAIVFLLFVYKKSSLNK